MILYASNPDGLAEQQQNYDRLYNSNNQANRNAFDSAQARAISMMLQQRGIDAAAQRQDLVDQQQGADQDRRYAFTADQADKEHASRLADVLANRAGFQTNHEEGILNEFSRLAASGQVSPEVLASYSKVLSPANFARANAIYEATKNAMANQLAIQNAPQIQAATEGQDIATAGNRFTKILADQAAMDKNPTPVVSDFRYNARWAPWPIQSAGGIPESSTIQPSEHAKALMASLQSSLAPKLADAGGKTSLIDRDTTGNFIPAYKMPVSAASGPAASPIVVNNAAQPAASQSDLVTVMNPAGKLVNIRRVQLSSALQKGYKLPTS